MRNLAGFALTTASAFLAIVAILIGSSPLFYITTAMIATIGACHLQAHLAVRRLRLERVAPETVKVGELVTVELTVWSDVKIRRPLISVEDRLPARLVAGQLSPSLPVAPAYDMPIRTQYRFRPLKRGRYRWKDTTVVGTDSLGLVTKRLGYPTAVAEMTVLPRPIPVSLELPNAAGWGISEAESGNARGAGIEPRGIREYRPGDSIRHVHWRSTARRGQLLVKEFESGTQAAVAFVLPRQKGSEIGEGAFTTTELMCGHVVYLAELFLRQGVRVLLPGLEEVHGPHNISDRLQEISEALAAYTSDQEFDLGAQIHALENELAPGTIVYVLTALPDESLVHAANQLMRSGTQVVALLYDAKAFVGRRQSVKQPTSLSPEFLGELQAHGISPIPMPLDVPELPDDEEAENLQRKRRARSKN